MARPAVAVLAAVLLTAGALAACTGSDGPSAQEQTAQKFLDAFGARKAGAAAAVTDDAPRAHATIDASLSGLGDGARGKFELAGSTAHGDDKADVRYDADWTLAGSAHWTYRGQVSLVRTDGAWRVDWATDALHPKLVAGRHLAVVEVPAQRATLSDSAGRPLFAPTAVVTVGLEKRRVADAGRLAQTLAAIPQLESTRSEILGALRRASPTEFVPLITLRRPVYEQLKPRIYHLPGTVFRSSTRQLAPSASFGRQLLGSVGEDGTAAGGLQEALDEKLAGTSGLEVDAVADADPDGGTRLATVRAARSAPAVRLTLDRRIQTAADGILAGVRQQASVVVVDRRTGRVLADANSAAATYDLGLAGQLPPGSTFKIATWAAAFTANTRLTPATRVACPATVTVDGRRFENENRFSYPPIPISAAFGYSCNTSAIAAALRLPDDGLADAARLLGLGADWNLPVDGFAGSVPTPPTQTERAADGIGQGRVLVSPLAMALLVGSASSGAVFAPQLLQDREPTKLGTVPAPLVAKLAPLLRATVQLPGGTAHDLAGLGVVGKTGTAEYGTARPPRAHSWFAGVRGDLAFAVFVYDGETAGTPAVPIAKRLLERVR